MTKKFLFSKIVFMLFVSLLAVNVIGCKSKKEEPKVEAAPAANKMDTSGTQQFPTTPATKVAAPTP